MLPGKSGLSLWLGPGQVTAMEAGTISGSIDYTGGFILGSVSYLFLGLEPGCKVPQVWGC